MPGIRATVSVDAGNECPVAGLTRGTDVHVISSDWSLSAETGTITEEVVVEGDVHAVPSSFEAVFSYGSRTVYRFERDPDRYCPCDRLDERIVGVDAVDGTLSITVDTKHVTRLHSHLDDFRSRYRHVSVDHVGDASGQESASDVVLVDLRSLTARQLEVVTTAHEMGYFEHPKGANAGQVAAALDITTSTFTEHLAAAQSKLLTAVFGR